MHKKTKQLIIKIIMGLILIAIVLYVLIWTGNLRCSKVPGMCGVYWGTMSFFSGTQQPSVTIIYDPADKEGMGNPYLLEKVLEDTKRIGVHPNIKNINYLSPEQLKGKSLVIVERARKIETNTLEMFINYVSKGGRLVWIGDAGVEPSDTDSLLTQGDIIGTQDSNTISGWARKNKEDYMIRFDQFLGINYLTSYCQVKECKTKQYDVPRYKGEKIEITYPDHQNGVLIPSSDHPLVYGMRDYLTIEDDFAIVEQLGPSISPLKIDYGSKLFKDTEDAIGDTKVFPLIVVSNSNRVAYYATPPEYFVEPDDTNGYYSIVENMIDGMLR